MHGRGCGSSAAGFGQTVVFTLLLGLSAAAGLGAHAQDATKPEAPKMMAADADPNWEVATVKPSDPNDEKQTIRVRGRHLELKNQTVEVMLMVAYGLQKGQIADVPEWVRKQNFDVDGVPDVDGQPNVQQFQSMLRKLLAERFQLKMHFEQREMTVFALKVAKNGPKLKDASNPAGLPTQEGRGGEGYRTLEFRSISIEDLTLMMMQYVDYPVVDQTGLKGRYDFTLKYTFDETRAPADGSAPPNLFTAMQEQAGLKLESVKAPAKVLVVDHVERPIAN